ncbi:MAG: M48 family metalloprotease [Alphaproteobacteria bacterium]|nr:M48 family metalloprotease [Alphaproteobacteria bacterium]
MRKQLATIGLAICLWLGISLQAASQGLIRDAEIEKILRDYTNPILEAAGLIPEDVGLYIINAQSLNAFVANGQRIHLHTGLIIQSETPGQLKGVIAHETGHIAGGHAAQRVQDMRVAGRTSLVSIGLGILAIAAGAGEAGAALLASSNQFAALNFFTHTRVQEASADQMAVEFLTRTGQSSAGLIEFFDNFRYQEVLSEARRYPYFRSHPLASDRIRSLRERAAETGLLDVPATPEDVAKLEIMHAKLIGFLEPPARVFQRYPLTDMSQPARYARSISAMQSADLTTAIRDIDSLIEESPENPYYHELKGQILFEAGRAAESVAPLKSATELLPNQPLILISYARSLIARDAEGDIKAGDMALRDALIVEPDNAFAWAQLAIAYEKQGQRPLAQLATAESAYNVGDFPRAYSFASRAALELEAGTHDAHRANDIRNATDPALPENEIYWRRRR